MRTQTWRGIPIPPHRRPVRLSDYAVSIALGSVIGSVIGVVVGVVVGVVAWWLS